MSELTSLPNWRIALSNVHDLYAAHGADAEARALAYADVYRGRRALMVFDVVASRQRRFTSRVLPMIAAFSETRSAESLQALADMGPPPHIPLRSGEGDTMANVAAGLIRYCDDSGLGEEDGVRAWAAQAEPFTHASKIEPYVGHVKGMGTALFAYLRMRCGANAIKPDLRVHAGLTALGFIVPNDPHALLVLAQAISVETGISLLALDQLLWWQGELPGSDALPSPMSVSSAGSTLHMAVPGPDATASELMRLAATIDGYRIAGVEVLSALGNAVREGWRTSDTLPSDLMLLRLALFFDYRCWHHYGEAPTERTGLPYQRALAEAMREMTPKVPIEPDTWVAEELRSSAQASQA